MCVCIRCVQCPWRLEESTVFPLKLVLTHNCELLWGFWGPTQVLCKSPKCSNHWAFSLAPFGKFLISLIKVVLFCFLKETPGQFYWVLRKHNRPDKLRFLAAARNSEEEQVPISELELEKAGRLSSGCRGQLDGVEAFQWDSHGPGSVRVNRLATLACSARKRQTGRGEEGEVLSDGCELSGST